MTDCCCGNSEGTNAECERCRLIARIERLKAALNAIAEYGIGSDRNDGICPYGCDCPHIAQTALNTEAK
jgi:hypothetical protein